MIELSVNETKLLKWVCQDHDNNEIAEKFGLSLRRTEKIKKSLYTKTKTHSNVGLLKWAVRRKLYTIR